MKASRDFTLWVIPGATDQDIHRMADALKEAEKNKVKNVVTSANVRVYFIKEGTTYELTTKKKLVKYPWLDKLVSKFKNEEDKK